MRLYGEFFLAFPKMLDVKRELRMRWSGKFNAVLPMDYFQIHKEGKTFTFMSIFITKPESLNLKFCASNKAAATC